MGITIPLNSHDPSRHRPIGFFAALTVIFCILSVVLYLPALRSFFHADDFALLGAIHRFGPFGIWSGHESAFLRPLISLSLYVDGRFWGLDPAGYHAANVLVHTLNALLVSALFPVLLPLLKQNGSGANNAIVADDAPLLRRGAALSGVLFLLQPTHPEAVTWISGRTDVYSAFFCLTSFLFYLRFRDRVDKGFKGSRKWLVGSLLLYGLSLLCKESAILFPFIVVAFEMYRARSGSTAGIKEGAKNKTLRFLSSAWPFFAVVVVYLLLRVCVLGKLIGGYGAAHTAFGVGQLVQATFWFFCSAFLPLLPRWSYCFAVLALLGVAFVFRLRQGVRPHPALGFLLVAFLLASAPVLNLGGGPSPNGMSGRLVYLASAFATLALIPLVDFLVPHRRASSVALVALAGVWGAQLYSLNLTWLQAGKITQQCIADLAPVTPAQATQTTQATVPTVVLAAPDNLYPAFILRNGLPEALQLFYPGTTEQNRSRPEVNLVSTVPLYRTEDGVTIYQSRTVGTVRDPDQQTFELVVANPPARLVQKGFTPDQMSGKSYQAEVISNTRLRVTLKGELSRGQNQRTHFLVFSNGHLRSLSSVPMKTESAPTP